MPLEQTHYVLRRIKMTHLVRWETNKVPEVHGGMLIGYKADLQSDIKAASPYLMKIGAHFLFQDTPTPEAITFILLANWLYENGVEEFKYIGQALVSKFLRGHNDLSMGLKLDIKRDE